MCCLPMPTAATDLEIHFFFLRRNDEQLFIRSSDVKDSTSTTISSNIKRKRKRKKIKIILHDLDIYKINKITCEFIAKKTRDLVLNKSELIKMTTVNMNGPTSSPTSPPAPASAVKGTIMTNGSSKQLEQHQVFSEKSKQEFMAVFPQIVKDLTEMSDLQELVDTKEWLRKVLEYNIPHGKQNRGLATALAYRYMCETTEKELTDENVRLSYILGWCVEMLQAFFLVYDDMMDESETRRGEPCWYKLNNLGPAAFNDAILINSCIYPLLKKYFGNKPFYVDLIEIMQDATLKTAFGQSLDTLTSLEKRMENYTMAAYSGIVKYKTSFYSFTLPVALAMAVAGITDPDLKRQATRVTLEMGHFFQVQDDYLDCFGDVKVTGKIGTDIQDCKCSWMYVVARQEASPEQMKILMANYGINELDKIELVKKLYIDMGIPEIYSGYEETTFKLILTHIQEMSIGLPQGFFVDMLHKIYKRRS